MGVSEEDLDSTGVWTLSLKRLHEQTVERVLSEITEELTVSSLGLFDLGFQLLQVSSHTAQRFS